MTWPSVDAPATAPSDHGEVRTQAYYAGGGDYFRSGYYSHGLFTSAATTTGALTLDRVYFRPFLVPVRRAFDRIGINVTTAATAASGGVLRFGIYSSSGGLPAALIVDAGTVSSESINGKEVVISLSLDPGVVWLAVVAQVSTCTVTAYAAATAVPWMSDSTNPANGIAGVLNYRQNSVSGALPSSATPNGTTTPNVAAQLRAA